MLEAVERHARAKINLSLEVVGRRGDGYHEVATVLHEIDVVDQMAFRPDDSLTLICEAPPSASEDNLVLRAARLLQMRTGCTLGAEIRLEKGIPVASGLGGGSSDGAATLLALNELWDLDLSDERLLELAADLGSDVPFFIRGGCVLGEGRGEEVTPLPAMSEWWVVLLVPPMREADKTGRMYSLLTDRDFSDGSVTRRLAQRLNVGSASLDDVATGKNAFEKAADMAFPGLDSYRQTFLDAGASFVRLCGSGPAFFSLFDSRETGESVANQLRRRGHEAYLATLVGTHVR